jgi:cysteine desulfurase
VNNETGVIQDIGAIAAVCHERGIPLHTDAAQSVGKLAIDVNTLGADLLSFTAHKIYGPQGIGALYVRRDARPQLRAVRFGGGQERGLRPGTLPMHQIIGFGVACEVAQRVLNNEPTRIRALRDRLWERLRRLDGVHLNGEAAPRLPEILNVSFEGVEGESLVTALPMLAVTTGSACSSASGEPSYVLRALGRSTQLAQSSLRFSLGRGTTEQDVDAAAHAVITQVERLRSVSPANASGTTRQVADSAGSFVYESDTLSPLARRYFDTLPGAVAMTPGDDAGTEGTDEVVRGEAGSIGEGTWVRFHLRVANGIVKAALFQAYGCPHTLAVAAWLTGQLPGRAIAQGVEQGVPGTPAAWLEALEVPVEKLGRLLRVEDALKASFQTPV